MMAAKETTNTVPYIHHLQRHRRMWEKKPAVRALYHYWYRMVVNHLAGLSPSVELGCGCGNFKEFCPEVIATDSFETPWCDQVADACDLPFDDASVGNLILFDVLHHLPAPLEFFSEASRVLKGGGRVVIVEPFITLWSRVIYGCFHHEPLDLGVDFFGGERRPVSEPSSYANSATATILFQKQYAEFARRFPKLKPVHQRAFSWLVYPMTAGFRRFCLLPAFAVVPLSRLEDFLVCRMRLTFLAMRILIVLEKKE